MADAIEEHIPIPKMNCAIPSISISKLFHTMELIIDNLQAMKHLPIANALSINVVSIIVGSFVNKADFDNPSPKYIRNHECPAFVQNLLQNPGAQISPALIEYIREHKIDTININQYMFLIDPMYSQETYEFPHGLAFVCPSVLYNPIISTNGITIHNEAPTEHIKYNSFLEPYIIPHNINEQEIDYIISTFQTLKSTSLLINIMDCSSNTLRRLWMQNTDANVYLAMPDCLATDNIPMYMPIITYDATSSSIRWINWTLDRDFVSLYQIISPHTYNFLIHNYKRLVLETYFIPICKILPRLRVNLNYKFNGNDIVFSTMTFQEFRDLWFIDNVNAVEKRAFAQLFISFMDMYYQWNYYKFIDILLSTHYDNKETCMQKILLSYLEEHLKQLKEFFPLDPIPVYVENDRIMQSLINDYLIENDIH
jgi:hypothetical protein